MPFRMPNLDEIELGWLIARLIASFGLIALGLGISRGMRSVLARVFDSPQRRYRGARVVGRIVALFVFIGLILIWAPVQREVLAVVTVFATALVIGLKEMFLSMVGWVHILLRSPYRMGDRIDINGVRGDVVDITLLSTKVVEVGAWVGGDQSTGRLVSFPNNWLFAHSVRNDTHGFGFIWNELTFTLTFDSDWHAAQDLLEALAQEMAPAVETQARRALDRLSTDVLIRYSVLTPFVYVRVAPKGIALTLRYLVEARKRRGSEHALTISFLDAIRGRDDVKLAET
ncbi:MAG: mechanosensitive ion channel [Rhodothermales bacterium]|nr:mechanosensitive ion channel [Rhodothermales bacterium]MCA0268399.1 mechanosensitive ion channel family protein [Bacteroidota bacterium]